MAVQLEVPGADDTAAGKTVFVYEAPVRLWHWINALAITVLALTGYLIASSNIFKKYPAMVGNHHARELFLPPVTRGDWWRGMLQEFLWYAFIARQPRKYVGHNPLANLLMFLAVTLGSLFMIATGFALYGEGAQAGHWANTLFTSWVIPWFGQSQDVHTWHHLVAWGIVVFVLVHVYAAIREDIMSRQTMIGAIINGSRTFRK